MTSKKNWSAKEEVTYLAGIEKHWVGYLLSLFARILLIMAVGLFAAESIVVWLPSVLGRLG